MIALLISLGIESAPFMYDDWREPICNDEMADYFGGYVHVLKNKYIK
jgi:hypothetical protein